MRHWKGRVRAAGAVPSVGTVGDALDNALAESHIEPFKTDLIRPRGPWKGLDEVELSRAGFSGGSELTRRRQPPRGCAGRRSPHVRPVGPGRSRHARVGG